MEKEKKQYKKITRTVVTHVIHGYAVMFFCLFFYGFLFTVIVVTRSITDEINQIKDVQILYNQPNPQILKQSNDMLNGYPMAEMAPYIAQEKPQVAAFLIAIAKKESAWGVHSPKLNGENCYNYWGFRQKRDRMGSGGHTCFDTPEEAVRVVADRIEDLINKKYDTPQKMIVWKCGFSCSGHSDASVKKWTQDVDYYYEKVYQ